jgi:peptidylprolyl isomerase
LSAGLGAGALYLSYPPAGGATVAAASATLDGTPPAAVLGLPELKQLLGSAESQERAQILASDESFTAFIEQEARNQAVLIAAYAQAVDHSDAVQTLMRRAAQRVLVEAYLNEVLRAQQATFEVTAEEAQKFYTDHPDQFRIPERVHLWQIFLPATSSTERQNAQALGRELLESLLSGKADFADLAQRHSGHPQSRLNGGYMGLIPVTELKPEIRKAIDGVAPGKRIGPVESAEGYHLLQRGTTVAGDQLSFEDAEPQVREYLRRQKMTAARAAAVAKMVATHPVSFAREQLPAWRAALQKSTLEGPTTAPPP